MKEEMKKLEAQLAKVNEFKEKALLPCNFHSWLDLNAVSSIQEKISIDSSLQSDWMSVS